MRYSQVVIRLILAEQTGTDPVRTEPPEEVLCFGAGEPRSPTFLGHP
jgi:hypothetical protein